MSALAAVNNTAPAKAEAPPKILSVLPSPPGWWLIVPHYPPGGHHWWSRVRVGAWALVEGDGEQWLEALVPGDGCNLMLARTEPAYAGSWVQAAETFSPCRCRALRDEVDDPAWCPDCPGVVEP